MNDNSIPPNSVIAATVRAEVKNAAQEKLLAAVERVSCAVRRFATASSRDFGSDCYFHALLGGALLADLDFSTECQFGYAGWRVGPGNGDVIGSGPFVQQSFGPVGKPGLMYHSWLLCQNWIVDFTTYQLRLKARRLDACDGAHTTVEWCPDFLLWPPERVASNRLVSVPLARARLLRKPSRGEGKSRSHGATRN